MTSYRQSHIGHEYGKNYDSLFAKRTDSLIWDNFVKPFVRAELLSAKESGANHFLDFACGTGRLLKVGHEVFGHSTGIDISEDMLEQAKVRVPNAVFICTDATKEHVSIQAKFDCVTMFRFLRNAEPDLRNSVLQWLAAHMQSGGTLIVNNHGNTASFLGLVTRLAFWLPDSARNLMTRQQTITLLENSGFDVVKYKGFRVLPSLFGRPILGRWLQAHAERLCVRMGLGKFGGELVFVAMRR